MRISVIGAGYVGLVTAAGLASFGHRVRVGESDPARLATLRDGRVPIYEPDLEHLVADGLAGGLLSFHGDNATAASDAEVVFIAVPTPAGPGGAADTTVVEAVVGQVLPVVAAEAVVVLKSTVPVGSVDRLQGIIEDLDSDATVVGNPEFLREGRAVSDFLHPDRIVIGSRRQAATERMIDLYREIQAPIVVTDPVSSEMVKYASNAYLATRITFANAIANVCEAVGADVEDVLRGMGYDRRIGFHFLNPGPGFGGSCLPKDTRALVAIADEAGYDFALLRGVIEVNAEQRRRVIAKVEQALGGRLAGRHVGVWGLAYKAGTDDIRESPAMGIVEDLLAAGATVRAFDPQVGVGPEGTHIATDPLDAVKDVDALVIATEWSSFKGVDLGSVRDAMRGDAIVDARNLLEPGAVRTTGLRYLGVGR